MVDSVKNTRGDTLPRAGSHLFCADAESALFFSRRGAPVRSAPAEGGLVQGGVMDSRAGTISVAAAPRMIAVGSDSLEDMGGRDGSILGLTPHVIVVMVPPRMVDTLEDVERDRSMTNLSPHVIAVTVRPRMVDSLEDAELDRACRASPRTTT